MGVAITKVLISFAVTVKLICAFVFAYADCWFSHGAAHLMQLNMLTFRTIQIKEESRCEREFDLFIYFDCTRGIGCVNGND